MMEDVNIIDHVRRLRRLVITLDSLGFPIQELINDEDFIVLGENEENTDQTQYFLGPKLSIDPNQTQRDASIYSFNFKVALLKRW